MINVTKNGETKIYKAVQELKNLVKQNDGNQKKAVIDQKFQSNSLIENTLEEEQKMGEDFYFFFNNNASQPKKKKVRDEKNKTVQHDNNKVTKFPD